MVSRKIRFIPCSKQNAGSTEQAVTVNSAMITNLLNYRLLKRKRNATNLQKDVQHVTNLFVRNVGMLDMTMSVIGLGFYKHWNAKQ